MEGVSIIIPNYNDNATLRRAVLSAVNQGLVIVVDDGSKADPYHLIEDLPVLYIKLQENRGLSAARNVGIASSSTNFILPLDADDELLPGSVEKLLQATGDIRFGNMIVGGSRLVPNKNPTYEDFLKNNQIYTTSLFTYDGWEKLGGYWEERVYEDYDFWGRAAKNGFKFQYVDTDVYTHNIKADGLCKQLDLNKEIKEKVINHIKEYEPSSNDRLV